MIRVQSDPGSDVGLNEVPMLFKGQESCQRLPIKDRQVQFKRCAGFADPLYDFPGRCSLAYPCLHLLGRLSNARPLLGRRMIPIPSRLHPP
jgi:hypothetical protein